MLFLLSWTLTAGVGKSTRTLAEKANTDLPDVLFAQITSYGRPRPNFVLLDYIDPDNCETVVLYDAPP